MRYWLIKSEPEVYSIDDLAREGQTYWDGVRNYQARNMLRDEMKVGDLVLYYHSNAEPPALVGVARVCREGYPDFTQFDASHHHYDADAKSDDPRWYMVDVAFVAKFPKALSLTELKADPELDGMLLLRKGQRLSVMPVEVAHFRRACTLGGIPVPE